MATATDKQQLDEFATINAEWVKVCEVAMEDCPASFLRTFTEVMFVGQRLITETRIRAQMNAATEELLRQRR